MKRVYKFALYMVDMQHVQMPVGARPLMVDEDPNGQLCLWALVDVDAAHEMVRIWILGTGHDMPDAKLDHLGSVVSGVLVWHVFREAS